MNMTNPTDRKAVKRFDPWRNADGVPHMKAVPNGAWVRWVDYCALLARAEAAEALEAAAIGLVDFHNGPPETKRPDIYQRHMVRIAAALRALADKGEG